MSHQLLHGRDDSNGRRLQSAGSIPAAAAHWEPGPAITRPSQRTTPGPERRSPAALSQQGQGQDVHPGSLAPEP